ncbi:MAG: serine/threonine-protein kinase [bacterium]
MDTVPSSDDAAGRIIAGRYEIIRAIGHGSFGRTFLARDVRDTREVAIKLLDRRADVDLKALELFEREAAVLQSARHQGIPQMYELVRDEWDGMPASLLVMEFIDGVSLREMIDAQRQLDPTDVAYVFLEMLGILEYLHSRVPPIVHRDIKPGNIIVRTDGRPVLVDFGSVRRVFVAADEAGSSIVGTYGYMPYEQYMGQATPSSDLYSLAATFLHLLTGRAPREFMNDEGRIQVPELLPGDARLRPIIAQLLQPSPTDRFASARDVRQALLSSSAGSVMRSSARVSIRNTVDLSSMGATPRQMDSRMAAILKRVAPSTLDYLDSNAKPGDTPGLTDVLSLLFFSALTVGILPAIFVRLARARRKRMRRFLLEGTPVAAEVMSITMEKIDFDQKMAAVAYQFEADGERHRDVDRVLPVIANRWQPGDRVQVLYLPDVEYDSVIVCAR